MRVSSNSDGHSADLQREALLSVGVDVCPLFGDHASSAEDDRPGLTKALDFIRSGACSGSESWTGSDTPCRTFKAIASGHKRMFLSQTDTRGSPGRYANHEQATDDTSFFSPLLALLLLCGVATEDNLAWRFLWHALDPVIRDGIRADQLDFDLGSRSNGRAVRPVPVYLDATSDGGA